MVFGHGLDMSTYSLLGLNIGSHCSRCNHSKVQAGTLREYIIDESVDWGDADGGGELRDTAAGRPKPGSFGEVAARLRNEDSVLVTLRGCPRLTVPLTGGLAEQVEATLRHGFEMTRPLRELSLPWVGRPADELQVAMHWRGGDIVQPSLLQQALALGPPPREAPPAFVFDTRRGGRLLLLSYSLAALMAVRAALPPAARLRFHLISEGKQEWFEPLVDALPGLQLHVTPLEGAQNVLRDLDVLASADVLLLGGGAFSELAASLGPARTVKLAPLSVWRGLPFRVPGAEVVQYPSGVLSAGARTALRRLHAQRALSRDTRSFPGAHSSSDEL